MTTAEGRLEADETLLHRIAAGDEEAFRRFVDRHKAALFRFCRSLTNDSGVAEDALQETFLTVWRKAGSFRGEGQARSWLFVIARRWLLRAETKRARFDPLEDEEPLERVAAAAGWGANSASLERSIDLGLALERLRPGDRQVLLLRDVEGLSTAEAAAVLGIEERALKSRLHRARLRLLAALRGGDQDG